MARKPFPTGPGSTIGRLRAKIAAKKAAAGKSSKSFAKRVLAIVKRKEETKYVAENILPAPVAVPAGQTTPLNLARMFPRLGQGVGDFQRVGDSVQPTRATAIWTIYTGTPNLMDMVVNLVVLTVKGATTDVAVAALPGGDLLKVGDGTNVDPNNPNAQVMLTQVNNYHINTDQYTLKKWYKRRIMKGANDINGPVGAPTNNSPPTGGNVLSVIKHSWKPPTLKYSDAAQNLPRNHYPVYCIWATNSDGTPLTAGIFFDVRAELSFKDA